MDIAKRQLLESHLGSAVASVAYMPGGCIGEVWQVQFEDGNRVVAKTSSHGHHLDIEGWMLEYLKRHASVPVPQVLLAHADFLVMEFIETAQPTDKSVENLARHIAALHDISSDKFGLERDTLIGPLPQPNKPCDFWIEFYAEHRLLYMAKLAREVQAVSDSFCHDLESFCGKLGNFLSQPNKPALLHGDLWSGNVLYRQGGEIALIDPAIYYGDGEEDIAYSQMFGGIDKAFVQAYDNLRPLSANFATERAPIYRLYALLVHARLFGGGYGAEAATTLKRFL